MPRRTTLPEGTSPPLSSRLDEPIKRINITVLQSQHEALAERGINVSALVRQLLEDYLSSTAITLHVDDETGELFSLLRDEAGVPQDAIVAELKPALRSLLDKKLKQLEELRQRFG